MYPMKCIDVGLQNSKHETDSVELRLANLFEKDSSVVHYTVWLVRVTVMIMFVISYCRD